MRRPRTAFDVLAGFFGLVSFLAEWTISIPPAGMPETFGYQSPACWLAVAGVAAALILEPGLAVYALLWTEAVLAAWFGWATWVVGTPRFTSLPFPFVPPDVIGSGFYIAGAALLAAAAGVVWELQRRHATPGREVWALSALPGFGLMRMGRWLTGVVCCATAGGAFYLASADSPDSTLFADYGRFGDVPPAYPRGAAWVLLATAAAMLLLSFALTLRRWRELQIELDSR